MEKTILKLDNVTSGYGKMTVLSDINLEVKDGTISCLIGANGVGKTTTLRTILGVVKPRQGIIKYRDEDISLYSPNRTANLGIAYSPEGRNVFGNLTVLENLRVGAYSISDKKEFKNNLKEVYSIFPRLEERKDQLSEQLSGGEQQMLALGRAIISKPDLLLLDEPSLGLAPQLVQFVGETMVKINQTGVSILLVEQNANLALNISDYAYVMEKGTIALQGKANELKNNQRVQEVYLGVG